MTELTATERVRALHHSITERVITGDCAAEDCDHESVLDCPTIPLDVCAHCAEVAEHARFYALEAPEVWDLITYPCPTIRALDGTTREDQ